MRLGLVAGILLAVASSLLGGRTAPGHHFAVAVLLYMVLFGVKVDVSVHDRVTSYARVIGGVPAGLGIFAWGTASVGSGLTRLMETAFSLPGPLRYSRNGLLRGAELMKRSAAFAVPEPHLANTIDSFTRECGLKGVTSGLISPGGFQKSGALFSSMATSGYRFVELHTNVALPATAYASPASAGDCSAAARPILAYCAEAHAGIRACLDSYYPGWARELAEEAGFVNRATNAVNASAFTGALSESYRELAGISMSAKDIIIQNAMINSYSRSVRSLAVASGSEAPLLSMSMAEARARQKNAFLVFGEMARHTLPYIRGLLQGMLYGIFPAVIFLAMTPLAARIIPAYATAMLWTELWNPIYAIVNLFSNLQLERTLAPYADGALTIISRGSLARESDMAMAVAGLAATIVPMIAYYVVSGSQHAVVGAVQQFMGPTQTLSTQSAGAYAAGNVSLGNVSVATGRYDTVTANKSDVARESITGNLTRRYDDVHSRPASSVGGVRITGREGVRFAAREELADTARNMEASREAFSESASAALSGVFGSSRAAGGDRSYSETLGLSSDTAEKKDLFTVLSTAEHLREKFGLSSQEALKMSWDTSMVYEAGAKAGVRTGLSESPLGVSVGAGARARGVRGTDRSAGERYDEALEYATEANSRVSFGEAFSQLDRTLSSREVRESLRMSSQETERTEASLSSAKSSLRDYVSHREKAKVYSEALSEESSFSAGVERDYTQTVFDDMRSLGRSDGYTARGLSDLRDGRYDTEEAEAVSESIRRVTGLERLAEAGDMPRKAVAAGHVGRRGILDVRPFKVDAEESFGEYRNRAEKEHAFDAGATEASVNENYESVREKASGARSRVGVRIEAGKEETRRDMESGKTDIKTGRENLDGPTRGVRERLERAKRKNEK